MTSLPQPAALTSACRLGPRTHARATANFLEIKVADSLSGTGPPRQYICQDLDFSGSRDHQSVTWPFAISWGCYIVTRSVSPAISKIMGPNIPSSRPDLSRSRDVISHISIRFAIYHFQLVSDRNRASTFNCFEIFSSKIHACAHTQKHKRRAVSDCIFCPMQCIAMNRQWSHKGCQFHHSSTALASQSVVSHFLNQSGLVTNAEHFVWLGTVG